MSKVRDLPEQTTPEDTDLLYTVDDSEGVNGGKKIKLSTLKEYTNEDLSDHLDGGASKHDASEVDYERDDLEKTDIQASSDSSDKAIDDLDDKKLSIDGNNSMNTDLDMGGNQIINTPTTEAISVGGEPTGFPNRTDSIISFEDSTRTMSISPVGDSFEYWIKATKYIKETTQSVTIPDLEGLYFFYFDGDTLVQDSAPPDVALFADVAFVALVYWDSTSNKSIYFAEERHGLTMDGATHAYLHNIEGARYDDGLALDNFSIDGDGSLDVHCQLDCSNGSIRDEDIKIEIFHDNNPLDDFSQVLTPLAKIPVYYKLGTQNFWRKKDADNFPFIYSGDGSGYGGGAVLPAYNEFDGSQWNLTEISNNGFVLTHIFATNNIEEPIIAIQGISQYNNRPDAREGAENEIVLLTGLPFSEFVPIGTVIIQGSNTFTNTTKAIFVSTEAGDDYIDFRAVKLFGQGSANDHGSLSGLLDDDHPIYLNVSGARPMAGNLDLGNNNIVNVNLVDGRDVSADGSKLDGIESGATQDQTPAEIKTAYESNANTNEYSDSEKTKLGFISVTQAVDLDTIEGDVALNNTHRSSDGKDHSDVVLNNAHRIDMTNPHNVTKSQVGLGNVTNDAQLKRAASDFNSFTEKTAPVDNDVLLLEDSEDSFNKKKVTLDKLKDTVSQPSVLVRTEFTEITLDTTTTATLASPTNLLTINITPQELTNKFIVMFSAAADLSGNNDGEISFQVWYGLTGSETRRRSTYIFHDATGKEAGSCAINQRFDVLGAGQHTIQIRWGRTTDTARIRPVSDPEYDHASLLVQEVTG